MNTNSQKIIDIILEIKEDKELAKEYNENSKIIEDIVLDSLEMINFVLRVEEEFNIEINFDEFDFSDLEDIKSFAEFIDITKKNQSSYNLGV